MGILAQFLIMWSMHNVAAYGEAFRDGAFLPEWKA